MALHRVVRLYVNFFQPSLKLIEKHRDGAKAMKKYDQAQTPYQRILGSEHLPEEHKSVLRRCYKELDPVVILGEMERLQDRLWKNVQTAKDNGVAMKTVAPVVVAPVTDGAGTTAKIPLGGETGNPARRMYRRTKKEPVAHTWRTREDPFAGVWRQVCIQLHPYGPARPPRCCSKACSSSSRASSTIGSFGR